MKKLMLVVLVMLAMVAVNVLAVDLPITNGDFDGYTAAWANAPVGWTYWSGNGAVYQSADVVASSPDGGARSLMYSGGTGLVFGQTTNNVIQSGQTYTISTDITPGGLYQYDGRGNIPMATVFVVLCALPAEGEATQIAAIQSYDADFSAKFQWNTYSASYVADSTYAGQKLMVYVQFVGRDYGPYIDSVRLSAVPEPATIAVLLTGIAGMFLKKRRNA